VIESLASIFDGPLAFARDVLSLPGMAAEGEAIPCAALSRPDVLGGLLDRFAVQHGGADRRAVVSIWTQFYVTRLIYPVLAANLLLGRDLPLVPEETLLLVGPEGNPQGFRLAHEGGAVTERGMERFAPLVRGHLAPMVQAVVAEGRVAAKLVWNNAGVRFAGTAEIAGGLGLLSEPAAADVAAMLENACWPDGSPNPLFQPYRDSEWEGQAVRRRKVCCLRYLLPAFEACGSACPLPCGRGESTTRH
jgi:ferric iron reductase protein FhuF